MKNKRGNLERRADEEFIKDVFIPGRLSKRLTRNIDIYREPEMHNSFIVTGFIVQILIYSPIFYGLYKIGKSIF